MCCIVQYLIYGPLGLIVCYILHALFTYIFCFSPYNVSSLIKLEQNDVVIWFIYYNFFFFFRVWLDKRYKVLTSNRPRHRLVPEVYNWEQIYKIEFETRQFEARRRFFELDQDPLNERRLNDHYGAYIQRKDRDLGRRIRKKRFADTYYPDV